MRQPARVGLLVNPTAGAGKAKAAGPAVSQRLARAGMEVTDLSGPTLATARDRARQGIVDGLDAIVVVGGDGMTHLGANLVAGTSLPLGIVAVGTGNDIARALQLPSRDIDASVHLIVQALRDGARAVDAVQVSTPGHSMSEWYVGVLSAGFDAAVNMRANHMRWPRGEARYVRAVLRELAGYSPYGYRITIDGHTRTQAGVLVAVANGTMIGGGMRIAPDASLDDGLLDIVIAGPASRAQLTRIFPLVFSGRHTSHRLVTVVRGREVSLEPASCGRVPPDAFADGERIGPLPLTCRVVRGALQILAPAS